MKCMAVFEETCTGRTRLERGPEPDDNRSGMPRDAVPWDLPRTPMRALGTLQQWSEDSVRASLGLVPGPCPKHHKRSQGSMRSADGADPHHPIDRPLTSSLLPGPPARELAFLSGLCARPGKSQRSVCRCLVKKLYLLSVTRAGMNRCSVVEGGPRYRGDWPRVLALKARRVVRLPRNPPDDSGRDSGVESPRITICTLAGITGPREKSRA